MCGCPDGFTGHNCSQAEGNLFSIYSKMGMPTIDTSCVVVPPTAHWERAKYKMHPGKVCVIVCCNAIMIIISNHRGFHRILRVM